MRHLTSGMMNALKTGGMEACYDVNRDASMKAQWADADYDPNPDGYYELNRRKYAQLEFPRMYVGKLVKALRMGVGNMRVCEGGIKVVWMVRDAEEARQSCIAHFGQAQSLEQIEAIIARSREAAHNRRDTEVLEVDFNEAMYHPYQVFERIAGFFDFPLDVAAAASVINPEYHRFKRSELEVGIV